MRQIAIESKYIAEEILKKENEILKFLGYIKKEPPKNIKEKIEENFKKIQNLLEIEYEYLIKDDEVLAIYTIGEKIEEKIKGYSENKEIMNALILDKIGIVALDCIKEEIIKKIEKETGKYVVKEIYPSSKEMTIEYQKVILNSMKGIKKIKINKFFQLFPLKTVGVKFSICNEKNDYSRCESCENRCF